MPPTEEIDIPQRLRAAKLGMLMPRAMAYWIDFMAFIGGIMLVRSVTDIGQQANDWLFALVCFGFLTYFVVCEWRWGKTLGKRIVGIVVVNQQGQAISFGQSLGRNVFRIFEALPGPLCLIGAFMILVSKDSQRLGDDATETYVVPVSLLRKPKAKENTNDVDTPES